MVNIGSIRKVNQENYKKVIQLRKDGLSYSEIRRVVPLAKSTLHGWLSLAGLTLTIEHFNIKNRKRIENWKLGSMAARSVRSLRNKQKMEDFLKEIRPQIDESLLIAGTIAYESEGSKGDTCTFSNSDPRLVQLFIKYIKLYFNIENSDIRYRAYIHDSRSQDLTRIAKTWSEKLNISPEIIAISWKHNQVTHRKQNQDYIGQMSVSIRRSSLLVKKLSALSGIIMSEQYGIV